MKKILIKIFSIMMNQYLLEKKKQMNRFQNVDFGGDNIFIDEYTSIGEYSYIGNYTGITKSEVGRYTSIGSNVMIGAGEHKLNWASTSAFVYEGVDWYKALTDGEVIIGSDVWIGTNAIIRRGVKIGNGAVVGANSFVNCDVPDFAIVVGSPARIVRYRFDETIINKIKRTKWWEKDLTEATLVIRDIDEFIGNIVEISKYSKEKGKS